jgi:parallel beta-helix repeat protein
MIVTSADIDENTVSGLSMYDGWNTTNPVNALLGTIGTSPAIAPPIDVTPKLFSLTEPGHWYWHDNTLYLYSDIPPDVMEVEVVSQSYAVDSNQKDYITIQELAVRGGNSAGVILQFTDYAIVRNLLIYDTGMLYWGGGITVWGANDNTISDNEVRSTLRGGILVTAWNGVPTTGNTISRNYIHHTGASGVALADANASDNIIEHNTIGYTDQLNFDGSGIKLVGSGTGNVIRFNRIFNGGSSSMKSAGIMADINPGPTKFYYNLIYGNNNGGIDLTGSGHEVYNNTLYHNNESIWNAGEIDFFPIGTGVSNCTVKNNIMVASDGKYLFTVNNWGYDSTQGHDIDYNVYMGNTAYPFIWGDQVTSDFDTWKTLSSQDAHSLETSTIGLNNPPIDFELSNNSPAIDAGIDVGLSYDFAGKPVPQNNFVDIGALEYPISVNIALGSATYSVAENGMSATIYVTRTSGSEGAVSIDYTTSDGTALAGYDYTAASGTLSWDDGDTLDKSFTVTILGDALVEGDETVNIVLSERRKLLC